MFHIEQRATLVLMPATSLPINQLAKARITLFLRWALLFMVMLLAILFITQQANPLLLILLLLLNIIAINFTLPPAHGLVGVTPVVAVTSVLVLGLETAVLLTLLSSLIAELARPLWDPMWDMVDLQRPSWGERTGIITLHLLSLLVAGLLYRQVGGIAPLAQENDGTLLPLIVLGASYGSSHLLLTIVHQAVMRRSLRSFLQSHGLALFTASLLAQPFAIFGGITFISSGLPFFVIFSLSVMFFSLLNWISWQRRFAVEQQIRQFSLLNDISLSLRERLELPVVLQRTKQRVVELVPIDRFTLFLVDERGRWSQFSDTNGRLETAEPDDFTRWTANQQQPLHVHSHNIHHAKRHGLTPPNPLPAAWLGIPLTAGEQLIGVMVLQRSTAAKSAIAAAPFNRWSQEMLLALAGQVSAAIQNARLFSETIRLYNLTDEALAQRVEQLQALLNTVAEGVLMVDTSSSVLLVNPMAEEILQQPAAELVGLPLPPDTAVTHLGYTLNEWQQQMRSLQERQPPPQETFLFRQQVAAGPEPDSSSRRFFTRSVAPVRAQAGQVMGWLVVLRDVTEEQALADQRTNLLHMIVHDLRNPVTTLISTLRQLEQPTRNEGQGVQGLLQNALQTCADLLDMVDSLMDINRMEAGQLQPDSEAMRLPPLLEAVLARLMPLAQQRQITLEFTTTSELPPIWADAELTRRILVNLLDNALKYTPTGGMIKVELMTDTAVSDHYHPGLRCLITDTGPGIPAEFRQRIFDPFLRTNRGGAQVQGTGLGLTFCKMAVEAQNGRIWAEDGPTGGSRFIFTLPGIPIFDLPEEDPQFQSKYRHLPSQKSSFS